jgi:predicted dehydrogenase
MAKSEIIILWRNPMIKTGVIGVGHLGQHHARILKGLPNSDLVGIYDKKSERASEIGAKLSINICESLQDLLDRCEAVAVSASTTWHYDLAKQALQQGKHVFLEKPITAELWQAEELVALAKEKNLKLQVGHIERFNPVILEIADQIHDPVFIESHRIAPFNIRGSDVPVIHDLMIHDIDLILSFIHSDIKEIRASGTSIFTKDIDIANARLEFQNGAIANVTASRVSLKQERTVRLFQRDAYMVIDFKDKKVRVTRKSPKAGQMLMQILMGKTDFDPKDLVDITEVDASDHTKDALTCELESFLHVIEAGINPIVDGAAGLRALQIATRIMQDIKAQIAL